MSTFGQKRQARGNGKGKGRKQQDAGPVNNKAERILIATCMLHNRAFETGRARDIRPFHFSEAVHAQTWEAVGSLISRGRRADASSVIPQINATAPIADMTTLDYLEKLRFEALANPAELDSFADAVILAWRGRSLDEAFAKYKGNLSAPGTLEALHEDLNRIAGENRPDTYGPVTEAIDGVMAGIRERKERGGRISGISTGYPKLDELLDGLRPATLTIIGARPKQSKTAILLCLIRNLCKAGVPCVLFSLEMPKNQIVQRLIALEANIDFSRMVRGRYDDQESDLIEDAAIEVDRWPLIIDDAGSLTPPALSMRARNAVNIDGAKVVFVDYLQRVSPEKGSKRYEEVTAISMALADLRKVLNVPIVCAAQLNRKLADRTDKIDFKKFRPESTRPTDGDLRDSGQIEQDADALVFINRPIVQLENMRPTDEGFIPDWEDVCQKWRPKAEVIVHYNRAGRTGIVDFRFSGPVMRFDEAI